ncbi:10519_t:CDS:2 [Dentiscutata erythropus]|uniref:10519_t:CDS:1 n=1 Tax=Dentiscutata erythropus TaxID=1348616 RepID=A0A9N8YT13_9GLOM|nr:10519_t:CDS:2 [Dentiscutata erythropus]
MDLDDDQKRNENAKADKPRTRENVDINLSDQRNANMKELETNLKVLTKGKESLADSISQ